MNERILELMKKAGTDTSGKWMGVEHAEKFAELLVLECMDQVWYAREDGINGNISEVIKERIKQHFGVEE
jgi:hypothetical protein